MLHILTVRVRILRKVPGKLYSFKPAAGNKVAVAKMHGDIIIHRHAVVDGIFINAGFANVTGVVGDGLPFVEYGSIVH